MVEKYIPHRFVKDQTSKSQEIADWMSYPVINVDAAFTVKETAQLMHDKILVQF